MDEPLPSPIIIPTEQGWLKKAEPPPGTWKSWEMAGARGWSLKLWPVFDLQVRLEHDRRFSVEINGVMMGKANTADQAMAALEGEVVRRCQEFAPAYRAVHARVIQRSRESKGAA